MSIKDSYNKRVTFDTWDGLEDKIGRLTVMMEKLTTRDNGINRKFKPQIYQSKIRGQSRIFYDKYNYDRGNHQNRYRSNSRDRRIQFSVQSRGRSRYEHVPCRKLLIAQLIVSSPTNQPVCKCLIIKLSTQVVTAVTNHS